MTILNEIANYTKERYNVLETKVPLKKIKAKALAMDNNTGFPFKKALSQPGISYICEVKKASPSKGVIAEDFPYLQIARDYENAGASAISCLTEPKYFLGSDRYLEEIAKEVKIPVLRKDFTVCPYQIYEAKVLGASAVLLICALLTEDELREYLKITHSLGLSALVEAHTKEEVMTALSVGAEIIGVNNRNLKDFTVDLDTCINLRKYVPNDIVFVGESGIKDNSHIEKLRSAGVDAVLIGETLMRSNNKKEALKSLNGSPLAPQPASLV
ncbi:MAG: indole-3-glycerol phosphate synthase TrpC [Ruminococcus sp.]